MESVSKDKLKMIIEDTLGDLEILGENLDFFDQENTNSFYFEISQFQQEIKSKFQRIQKESGKIPLNEMFGVPLNLSKDLCDFLDVPLGTRMSRTDVTKKITNYILRIKKVDSKNSYCFNPDIKLLKLLGEPLPLSKNKPEKCYSFLNLQHYLKDHFKKVD